MAEKIFLINENKEILEVKEKNFLKEEELQNFLLDHPELIPGDQIDPNSPRRWLPVSKESGLPDKEDSGDHFSVDLILIDQDGIPTFVEFKKRDNKQLKREVVGQLLEYASCAKNFLGGEKIRIEFEEHCKEMGQDPDDKLQEFLGEEKKIENFWEQVDTNLKAGKMRLIVVSEIIPQGLKRIIEFLNQQMESAEILAVEIRNFQVAKNQIRIIVPQVFGQEIKPKIGISRFKWDKESFIKEIEKNLNPENKKIAMEFLSFVEKNGIVDWGTGSFGMKIPDFQQRIFSLYFTKEKKVEVGLGFISNFLGKKTSEWISKELINLGFSGVDKFLPSQKMEKFNEEKIQKFFQIIQLLVAKLKEKTDSQF